MELRFSEISSVLYHDIFDYPLNFLELNKWSLKKKINFKKNVIVTKSNGFYCLKGREKIITKRKIKDDISMKKIKIATNASYVLGKIKTIKLVCITGSLAMNNAEKNSDIDLMIVTKKGKLWTTRIISYLYLTIYGFKLRKPNDKKQKDRLCLNMWLDESDLVWRKKDRNIYSAHEIAQIKPLFNKDDIYEKFIYHNGWIKDFWPNATNVKRIIISSKEKMKEKSSILENLVFLFQYLYMKNKITCEVVTKTRAIFHPNDVGKLVVNKLSS